MRVKKRFELPDDAYWCADADDRQVYRFEVTPEPRHARLLLVSALVAPVIVGLTATVGVAKLTRPAPIPKTMVTAPAPAPAPIRKRWEMPTEYQVKPRLMPDQPGM